MSLTLRYETLSVATEAESRQDPDLPLKTGGKRLMVSPKHPKHLPAMTDSVACSCHTIWESFPLCDQE